MRRTADSHRLLLVAAAAAAFLVAGAVALPTAAVTGGNPVLVVAAHPDDEALGFAGIIESALAQGRPVYVAVATNGDAATNGGDSGYCGAAGGTPATTAHLGVTRDGETVAGMGVLGLARTTDPATTQIFFLGYPDGTLQTIASSTSPWAGDATGLHRTYANDGDGSSSTCNGELHYLATGSHAQLTASSLSGDLDRLLALTTPTDVYTHAAFDGHSDHATLHQLVLDALRRAAGTATVHTTLVHPAGTGACLAQSAYLWPNPSDPTDRDPYSRFTPGLDVTAPPTPACSASPTGSSWGAAGPPTELVAVPADMRTTDPATNRKWQAISRYASQISCTANADGTVPASCGYLRAFVKAHEFFWTEQVAAPSVPVNTQLPTLSGSAAQGQVMSATTGSWTGFPTGYAYAWQRCDGGGGACLAVAGASGSSYTLAAGDVGHTIRVSVTASNGAGSATAASDPSAVVTATGSEGAFGQTLTGSSWDNGGAGYLDVSGPNAVGQTVTVTRLNAYVSGGSATSRVRGLVYRDDNGRPGALVAAGTETSTAAGAAAAWVSLPLAAPVVLAPGSYWLGYWYADGNGRRAYLTQAGAERYAASAYSATGSPPATFPSASSSSSSYSLYATYTTASVATPANTALPTISGSPVQGQTLTATTGTWTGNPTGYSYEWLRCDTGGNACTTITGTIGAAYTVTVTDLGGTIRVAVTATSSSGSTTATSNPTLIVTGGGESRFGQATIGTNVDTGAAGYLDLSGPYTTTAPATITRLDAYLAGGSSSSRQRAVVYADSSGQPGALVAAGAETVVPAGAAAGWMTLPLREPVTLPAGRYWLGYWYADGNSRHYYLDVPGAERYRAAAYSATADPPASFGAASTATSSYALTAG